MRSLRPLISALAALAAAAAAVVLLRRRRARADAGRLEWRGPGDGAIDGVGGTGEDARLLARVESELFRDPALPKGDIVLDAVAGVVTIRGQVAPDLVEDIAARVAAVEGVARVENLLHAAPGE